MNYYERYCGDYGRDTAHLDLSEHGAYTLLLDTYYATERPLPEPYEALYRICRAMSKGEQSAVRGVADEFFPIGPDGLRHNPRADREIADAAPRIDAARVNGRKGGRPPQPEPEPKPNGLTDSQPTGLADCIPSAKLTKHQHQTPKHQRQKQQPASAWRPPPWVPSAAWAAFDDMRKAKSGRAWTDRAKDLAVGVLHKLGMEGHDPAAVLEQSVVSGWSSLYPLRQQRVQNDPRQPQSLAERRARNIDILTGKARDERTIEGTSERVAGAVVFALPGDLRESDGGDVGDGGPGRSAAGMG